MSEIPYIKSLFIYPAKSLGGIEVDRREAGEKGLESDRQWMLVNEEGQFITQRELPAMARVGTRLDGQQFQFFRREFPEQCISIPKSPKLYDSLKVRVWQSKLIAYELDPGYSRWFSEGLGKSVKLVAFGDRSERTFYQRKLKRKIHLNFSDGYPYLVVSQASVDLLNNKLAQEIPVSRFRPNIVIEGMNPHQEDQISGFKVNECYFKMAKPCARCAIITTDQITGDRYKEPLKTLATYRKKGNQILFGMNAILENAGELCKGDKMKLI